MQCKPTSSLIRLSLSHQPSPYKDLTCNLATACVCKLVIWLKSNLFVHIFQQKTSCSGKKRNTNKTTDFHMIHTNSLFSARLRLSIRLDFQCDFRYSYSQLLNCARWCSLALFQSWSSEFNMWSERSCACKFCFWKSVSHFNILPRWVNDFNDFIPFLFKRIEVESRWSLRTVKWTFDASNLIVRSLRATLCEAIKEAVKANKKFLSSRI